MFERQLAIISMDSYLISAAFSHQKMEDVIIEKKEREQSVAVGDIYIAKVKNVVPNIQAAFVEIQKDYMCYLPLKKEELSAVKQGMEFPVQIVKPAVKSKQPVCSRKIELAGMYAVITTENLSKNISKKITNLKERQRFENLLETFSNEEYGFIIRTTAQNVADKVILEECHTLLQQMKELQKNAPYRTCFTKMVGADREYVKYIQNCGTRYFDRIITDVEEVYEDLKRVPQFQEESIVYYQDSYSLDKLLGIQNKLKKCQKKHVWLKSGGSLVIELTEALTVIDVNTEKAMEGKRDKEKTFFKINKEAAVEAACQMRLRNLSGIILIDFIDMEDKNHIDELLELLRQEVAKDSVPTKVIDMTALGLVELTRKKVRKPLHEWMKG